MLADLDALERETAGGKEYWVSHGDHYELAGLHVHATMHGPLGSRFRRPIRFLGVNALAHGHQYLALSAVSCALLADDHALQEKIEARYESVVAAQRAEIGRMTLSRA